MSENENLEQEVVDSEVSQPEETSGKATKPKKVKTPKPEQKKPNVFQRIGKWLHELRLELKKVQWPTAKQTSKNVVIVIICVIVVGVCIWLFDSLASGVINALLNLFGKA